MLLIFRPFTFKKKSDLSQHKGVEQSISALMHRDIHLGDMRIKNVSMIDDA